MTLSDDAYIFWFIGICFVLFGVPNRRHSSLYVYRAYNMYILCRLYSVTTSRVYFYGNIVGQQDKVYRSRVSFLFRSFVFEVLGDCQIEMIDFINTKVCVKRISGSLNKTSATEKSLAFRKDLTQLEWWWNNVFCGSCQVDDIKARHYV